ncbi:hypothetical protein LSAT2_011843 [Lamellibrachia satsuma]|nr:hypothetical protein LSAT2_011843 [Lamellibrachia satsuma]
MNILGYVIDEHGIRPNDELVTGIVEAAVPENKQQLRSFLGVAGFYAKFVPNFSTKAAVLVQQDWFSCRSDDACLRRTFLVAVVQAEHLVTR